MKYFIRWISILIALAIVATCSYQLIETVSGILCDGHPIP